MYRNNFDTSSTGTNIEFSGRRDTDLSHWEFKDNFEVLKWGRSEAELIFFTDYGQIEAPEKIGDVFYIKKDITKKRLLDFSFYESGTRQEIIDDILDRSIEDYNDFKPILTIKNNFEFVATRGYCQGDVADVLINKDFNISQEDIDHLFWDSPINATITINKRDYEYWDYELDDYVWQREEFAELVARDSGVDKQTLLAILPEHLDYN